MAAPEQTYDVGILGWWYGKNYGSILTYYGLNRAIKELGFSTLMVHEPVGYNGYRVLWPDNILSMEFARRVGYHYTQQKHFSELPALNARVRTFVVGSDQLWNPLIGRVNDDLFLDFVGPENRRVSYATSFGNRGTSKFQPDFVEKHSANLQKFSAISVREGYAVDTARDVFGVQATQVVDPVFLLPTSAYDTLADKANVELSGDYLAVFYLDPNPEKRSVTIALADRLGLKRILVIPNPDGGRPLAEELFADPRFEIIEEDAPENFLHAYRSASYVVTDSFHGTAFATIFGKPFSSIYNTQRGVDRFKNLLDWLGFGDSRRLLESDTAETLAANPGLSLELDYALANARIAEGRTRSLAWLQAALTKDVDTKHAAARASNPHPAQPNQAPLTQRLASPEAQSVPLDFKSNNGSWAISGTAEKCQLSVVRGAGERGNLVYCHLPGRIQAGLTYRLSIDWEITTTANVVSLNLRNGKTAEFRAAGHVAIGEKRRVRRTDELDFSVDKEGFNQIMMGASQFKGKSPGLIIHGITLKQAPADALKVELAVPNRTRTFAQIIAEVSNDKKVRDFHDHVNSIDPEIEIHIAKPLKEYTYNSVGGPADILAFPRTTDQFVKLVKSASGKGIPVTVLGLFTNLLVRDGGIRGLVVSTMKMTEVRLEDDCLTAGAGAGLTETAFFLQKRGKSGLEWAAGIPGTVGGAIVMNAGTNISDIRRSVETVTFLDRNMNIRTVHVADVSWGKRHSSFQENKDWIILEATFRVRDGDREAMRTEMVQTVEKRARHFPLDLPNHGSTFKWWRAPRLISQSGLVGHRIGGAQISTKQPGFFVNLGNATASDYEALINYAIAKVYEFSGFLMEPEVEVIGERLHRYERYSVVKQAEDANSLDVR